MTTTKSQTKTASTATGKKVEQDDLQTAYEIHTLAQLVVAQLATADPWAIPAAPPVGFQNPTAWMPPVHTGAVPPWPGPTTWPW